LIFAKHAGILDTWLQRKFRALEIEPSISQDLSKSIVYRDVATSNGTQVVADEQCHSSASGNLDGCDQCSAQCAEPADLYHCLPSQEWLRLLVIEPGEINDQLVCQLRCAQRSETISSYEALSYSWNEPCSEIQISSPTIICRGVEIQIQPNLWLALRRIRLRKSPRVIWADALCINQSDNEERSLQVQSMTSVYTNARQTLIWLGETSGRAMFSLELVCQLVNGWDEKKPAHFWTVDENTFKEESHKPTGAFDHSEFSKGFKNLFDLGWFTRKWVIQEVALSPSAQVMWENCRISWDWIGIASAILRTQHNDIVRTYDIQGAYNAYLIFRLSRHGGLDAVQLTFLQLLRLSSRFKTTDPRDAIFALLGLQTKDHHPKDDPFVVVDYDLNLEDLCMKVAEKFLSQADPLKFLANAEIVTGSTSRSNRRLLGRTDRRTVPSWIPRWGEDSGSLLGPWSIGDTFTPSIGLAFERCLCKNPSHLAVRGIKVSTVLFSGSNVASEWLEGASVMLLLKSGAFGQFTAKTLETFTRTLTAGTNEYGSRETQDLALVRHFAAFLKGLPWWSGSRNTHNSLQLSPPLEKTDLDFPELDKLAREGDPEKFRRAADRVSLDRQLFVTTNGHLGLGPWQMLPGDIVCVLGGADMPFVIRRTDNDCFTLVGECYVDDIMNGEAVDAARLGKGHRGPFSVEDILEGLFYFPENLPRDSWELMSKAKREILELVHQKYDALREAWIELC
jgi:hypothetical protein